MGKSDTTQHPPVPEKEPSPLKFQQVHIIVNPAAGQSGPNLPDLNRVLNALEIEWEMFVTRRQNEAFEWAKRAVRAAVDAVVVFGGDGTVLEVASGLTGSGIPLIILPGGTANALALELGIPLDQTQAAQLLGGAPNAIRHVDMGALQGPAGDTLFFHLGMGLEGALHRQADRAAKDRSGLLAYVIAALNARAEHTPTHYHLLLDGETVEVDGINCMITNFGSIGLGNITLSRSIDVSDGLLDVIVFEDAKLSSLVTAAANALTSGEVAEPLLQWQAHEVSVVANPPQPISIDGEVIDAEAIEVRVVPRAVEVVVPVAKLPENSNIEPSS